MNAVRLRDSWLTLRFECLRVLGVPGLLGVVLLGAAAALWVSVPAVRDDARLYDARARAARVAQPPARRAAALLSAPAPLSLPARFPTAARSGDDLAEIFRQAQRLHLTLGSAQYQIATEPGGRFTRYQVLLPVKDRYPTIRRFLAAVLDTLPNAALQEIHVERPAVSGDVLDARIRFDLIYRTEAP